VGRKTVKGLAYILLWGRRPEDHTCERSSERAGRRISGMYRGTPDGQGYEVHGLERKLSAQASRAIMPLA